MLSNERVDEIAAKLQKRFPIPFVPDFMEINALKLPVRAIADLMAATLPAEMAKFIDELKPEDATCNKEHARDFIIELFNIINPKIYIPLLNPVQKSDLVRIVIETIVMAMTHTESMAKQLLKI